jgi:hypothetical protein
VNRQTFLLDGGGSSQKQVFIPSSLPYVTLSRRPSSLECIVQTKDWEFTRVMASQLAFPEQAASNGNQWPGRARKADWTIAITIGVIADPRRLLQALTVPEYLEAWISIPDMETGSSIVASQEARCYRLDHYCDGRLNMSITGACLFCNQRKMSFSWRKEGHSIGAESLVDFRLRGNSGSSILQVRHSALSSFEEYLWHQQLWHDSLHKLTSLF